MVELSDVKRENSYDHDVKFSNGQSGQHTSTIGLCDRGESLRGPAGNDTVKLIFKAEEKYIIRQIKVERNLLTGPCKKL